MRKFLILAAVVMLSAGCASQDGAVGEKDGNAVAGAFARAAELVYSQDWIGFDEPVEEWLTPQDLTVLAQYRTSLDSMIETALGLQDSVWGAKLAGHFKVEKALPLLRSHLLEPRHCYGWEGPDCSKLEHFLRDDQYQYSFAYLQAIETITGKPVSDAINLTPDEAKFIQVRVNAGDAWAVWTQRKLD